jgi:hypothetical protein
MDLQHMATVVHPLAAPAQMLAVRYKSFHAGRLNRSYKLETKLGLFVTADGCPGKLFLLRFFITFV